MESEESRPGSSASNSSSNSSGSRDSTNRLVPDGDCPKSPVSNSAASPVSEADDNERPDSRSFSFDEPRSPRSPRSDSESSCSSSSSTEENDNEVIKSAGSENEGEISKSKASSERSNSPVVSMEKLQSVSSPQHSPMSGTSRSESPVSRPQTPLSPGQRLSRNSISHEDLSDVSDMESEKNESLNNSRHSINDGEISAPEDQNKEPITTKDRRYSLENKSLDAGIDLRQRLEQKKNQAKSSEVNGHSRESPNRNGTSESFVELVKTHDEDALDFEAEEGECPELNKEEEKTKDADVEKKGDKKEEPEEGEELEEGEVSDEDEKRPEENEPKPVCRFYTRGQCTWGMSCRFLHPGVTDKGNYTMFDMIPPVSVPPSSLPARRDPYGVLPGADYRDYRTERPALHHRTMVPHTSAAVYASHPTDARALINDGPVVVESAWERGLRTAKEMMRKANKRKEQDIDFEDKKMNLTLSPEELEKDPYYLKERSPDVATPYGRHAPIYTDTPPSGIYSPPDRYGRGPPIPAYDDDPYRAARYRELPPHRMPHYEDERRVRPTREVIVQRVEPPITRGDEWNDPWMRSKSPLGRGASRERSDKRRRDQRSYSSQSSYSSSTSSQSDSSSSSRSLSSTAHHRRYNSSSHKSPVPARSKHIVRGARSPSQLQRRIRRSASPPISKRHHASRSHSLERRGPMSPSHKRKKFSPIKKPSNSGKLKGKRRRTSSSSGSSDSSASDSDSSTSSSSGSSSHSRGRSSIKCAVRMPERPSAHDRKLMKKSEPPRKRSPISIEIRRPTTVGTSALMSPPTHVNLDDPKKTRREELLKQLKAVEDAIAKKRSKLS